LGFVEKKILVTWFSKYSAAKTHFSRFRIEVNSASRRRTSDKRFEILRQFATESHEVFMIANFERYQFDFKVGQKTQ
jgi:hypothetical protein